MVRFRVAARLPLPADTYFLERDSAAFRALVARSLRLGSLDIVDAWPLPDGGGEAYRIVTKPNVFHFVPDPLRARLRAALAGGALEYADVVTYRTADIEGPPYTLRVVSTPPLFAKAATIASVLTIAPAPDAPSAACIQTLTGVIEFRVGLGVGRLVESVVVDNLKKVYAALPSIVAAWAAFRTEALALPAGGELLLAGRPLNAGVAWIGDAVAAVAGADAAVSPGGAGAARLGGGVRVGADTFYDASEEEEEGGAAADAAAAPSSPPASPFAARAALPPPRSWAAPLRRLSGGSRDGGAAAAAPGPALSVEAVDALRRAGTPSAAAAAAAAAPSRASLSLWFSDGPAPPAAAARHSRRWRAFWRRRRARRVAAVPDAAGLVLGCLAGPAAAADAVAAALCGGRGGEAAKEGEEEGDEVECARRGRRWCGGCWGGASPPVRE